MSTEAKDDNGSSGTKEGRATGSKGIGDCCITDSMFISLLAAEQWGAMSFDSKELFKKEVEEEAEVEEDANEDGKTQRRRFSPSRLTSPLTSPAA